MTLSRIWLLSVLIPSLLGFVPAAVRAGDGCGCEVRAPSCCHCTHHKFGRICHHHHRCCEEPVRATRRPLVESAPLNYSIMESAPVAMMAMPMQMMAVQPVRAVQEVAYVQAPRPRVESAPQERTCEASSSRLDKLESEVLSLRERLSKVEEAVILQKDILLDIRDRLDK